VIARMQALFKKAPAAKEPIDINEIIRPAFLEMRFKPFNALLSYLWQAVC
jgi:hypothetical protein